MPCTSHPGAGHSASVSSFLIRILVAFILDWFLPAVVKVKLEWSYSFSVIGAGIVLVAGMFAFLIRWHFRVLYGLSEIAAGAIFAGDRIFSAMQSRSASTDLNSLGWALLGGGIYLIVRGLDNLHQYFLGKANDRLVAYFDKIWKQVVVGEEIRRDSPI